MTTDHTPPADQTVDDLRAEIEALRQQHWASLRRADQINNDLMQEVQRYAAGDERPVLWSVYNEMHKRALKAEAEAHQYRTALQGVARRAAVLPPPVSRADKAEALLLHFTAEAHRRKWNYDRGLDDDGVPIKSEAFDALHRLGEEMRVELEKLRRMAAEAQPEGEPGRAHCGGDHSWDDCQAYTALVADEAQPGTEVRTPCSVPNPCEGGELCATHEKEQAHAEGEHAFCGDECEAAS